MKNKELNENTKDIDFILKCMPNTFGYFGNGFRCRVSIFPNDEDLFDKDFICNKIKIILGNYELIFFLLKEKTNPNIRMLVDHNGEEYYCNGKKRKDKEFLSYVINLFLSLNENVEESPYIRKLNEQEIKNLEIIEDECEDEIYNEEYYADFSPKCYDCSEQDYCTDPCELINED